MHKSTWIGAIVAVVAIAAAFAWHYWPSNSNQDSDQSNQGTVVDFAQMRASEFGTSVEYQPTELTIDADLGKDFSISEIQNIKDMEEAYGLEFTDDELQKLSEDKFILKSLTETTITPNDTHLEDLREILGLYRRVQGNTADLTQRGQENSVFISTDVFFDTFNSIYTELLKEMENEESYPAVKKLSETLFEDASEKLAAAKDADQIRIWTKVRNYFAVPYALFSTAQDPLEESDYYNSYNDLLDPDAVLEKFNEEDPATDIYQNAANFVKDLKLDDESEEKVLADLKIVFDASGKAIPNIFAEEYQDYANQVEVAFFIDFSQFTPRGTYTSSSLRREYFRGMKWFGMVPFFLASEDLTDYAFAASELLAGHQDLLDGYNRLESAIDFLVGNSDDLMPIDYLEALSVGREQNDPEVGYQYLVDARNPKIKDLPAFYDSVGTEQSEDVLLKTKSMRFFSSKFILDSYWTEYLTQGDEAVQPGYTQKLPPYASSLQVMALLGSDYAKSQIPNLDFYSDSNNQAIDQAMSELAAETDTFTDEDWQANVYTSWLWTINGLFDWSEEQSKKLPAFMQSEDWAVKTLQTASAWWSELRHATILYAKQSFAELGGGPGSCPQGDLPEPPKGYIEPNIVAFDRLDYLSNRLLVGLQEQNFDLANFGPLKNFVSAVDLARTFVEKELTNTKLSESVTKSTYKESYDDEVVECVDYNYEKGESDWETIRTDIVNGLVFSIPIPTEGAKATAKDRRTAMIADVHTGGDSNNPTSILYEGTGVPYLIFTAVKDINGPRLTIGFVLSHYEFMKEYGDQRLTDEDWQENFYESAFAEYNPFVHKEEASWPERPTWYSPLF